MLVPVYCIHGTIGVTVAVANESREILWENIFVSKGAKKMRSFIGDTVVMFLIVVSIGRVMFVAISCLLFIYDVLYSNNITFSVRPIYYLNLTISSSVSCGPFLYYVRTVR